MKANPTVSVIVPTFNRGKLLLHAIQSITAQSFQDFEVIVIDDGSTDDTRSLLLSINDPRIRYFFQENQGLPAAWNTGIAKSLGRYVAFLDSDDTWLREKLALQIEFLEGIGRGYAGCVTGYFLQALNGRRTAVIPTAMQTSLREIMWKNILHLGTTFICRRDVFHDVGPFDEILRRGQDTDWLIRYRSRFEIGIVPETLAVFNQHLARSGEIMEKSLLYLLEKHKADMLKYGGAFYRKKEAVTYRDLAFQFSREDNPAKAREYSRKALAAYPLLSAGLLLILIDVHLGTRLKRKADTIKYPGIFQ